MAPLTYNHLTSLSTQTLTLLLERQRLASITTSSSNAGKEPSRQIKRNLETLRVGILSMEESSGKDDETRALREQYERMRGMLGGYRDVVESLEEEPEPEPSFPVEDQKYVPYRDDPDALERGEMGQQEADPYAQHSDEGLFGLQQELMDDQDVRLDTLSQSINRQHDISLQINGELETHSGLLEGLDQDLDRTDTRLSNARRKLDKFSRGVKGNGATVTIGLLIAILLILIVVFKT